MNLSKKQLFILLLLLWSTPLLFAQACGCLNCPASIPVNFNTFQLDYPVNGASNDALSGTQCVESVELQFSHNRIQNLGIELLSPAGQVVTLVGNYAPFGGGLGGSTGATWAVRFTNCGGIPSPDPGLLPNWDNLNPAWNVFFGRFTGTYFPPVGNCLENFNTGSINGTWQLRVTNYDFPPVQSPGVLEGFKINFCDETGIAPPTISRQERLCEGETIEVAGQVFDTAGSYEVTIPASTACDTVLQLDLQYFQADLTQMDTTVCVQERVNIGNQSFAVAGQYEVLLQNQNGCDSVVLLNLAVENLEAIIDSPSTLNCNNTEVLINATNSSSGTGLVYTWTTDNGNILSGADSTMPIVDAAGDYTLQVESANGCFATASISVLEDRARPQIDLPAEQILTCNRNTYQPELGEAEADVRYTWRDVDGVAFSNIFEPNLFVGTYTLIALNTRNECADSSIIKITQFSPPNVRIDTENIAEDCLDFRYQLSATGTDNPLRYTWIDANGIDISTNANLEIIDAGTYYLEAFDAQTRCTALDSIVIMENDNQAISGASIDVQQLDCLENTSGRIVINAVQGGTNPFVYALDDAAFGSENDFPQLPPDTYQIRIEDLQGCTWDTLITIDEFTELEIDLGENRSISMGEDLRLEVMSNQALQTYRWTSRNKDSLDCPTCAIQNLNPLRSDTYTVEVVDENGCTASNQITISVSRDAPVYIPTAFSPNDDGQNDFYAIYPRANAIQAVKTVQIFDRWGALVFEQNTSGATWDGRFKGVPAPQGIYVLRAKIIHLDGREEILSAALNLVR